MAKFTVDLRFVFLERELWALGEFLSRIEPQVKFLQDQDGIQTRARLSEEGYEWDDPDLDLELQDLDQRVRIVFPRLLRNPFLVSLFAAYESGVPQIASDLARKAKTNLMLRDIRGENFLDRAQKYFREVLHTPLDLDDSRLSRLADLATLRNVIAHANGEKRAVPSDKWRPIESIVQRVPSLSISDGYLIASEAYLTEAYGDVNGSLRELIDRVRGPAVRQIDAV